MQKQWALLGGTDEVGGALWVCVVLMIPIVEVKGWGETLSLETSETSGRVRGEAAIADPPGDVGVAPQGLLRMY